MKLETQQRIRNLRSIVDSWLVRKNFVARWCSRVTLAMMFVVLFLMALGTQF